MGRVKRGGLFLLKPQGAGFDVLHFSQQSSKLPGNYVGAIRQLKNGSLFVGTNHGIVRYDYKKGEFMPWQADAIG
jgi:ligand-binding sensor domain-containing protein